MDAGQSVNISIADLQAEGLGVDTLDISTAAGASTALAAIDTDRVSIGLTDSNSSCLITPPDKSNAKYVVMPMRL